jgi:MFS family permease
MGFLGVLETRSTNVPGTIRLDERGSSEVALEDVAHLKHGTGRHVHIVLSPQPSDDPNEPLNWSPSKKLAATLIVGFGSCLYAAAFGRMLDAGAVEIAIEFQCSITAIIRTGGYQLLVTGGLGPFVSAAARKWGKRPVFIASSVLGLAGSVIGAVAKDFDGLLAARLVQGASGTAYASLVAAMIGDLFFVHERGLYVGFVGFVLAVVANLAPTICGPITNSLGWRYLFYLCIAFSALQTILLVLFVPETQYRRNRNSCSTPGTPSTGFDGSSEVVNSAKQSGGEKGATTARATVLRTASENSERPAQKTFRQNLAIFTGTYSDENYAQLLIAPLAVCMNLAVLWSVLASGYLTATYVVQASVMAQIFAAPPYLLNAAGVGYLFLGPFVGGVLGSVAFALTMDPIAKYCSRRNGGIYEPEYRLLGLIGGFMVGAGLLGFGTVTQNHGSYYITATLQAIAMFGELVANDSLYAYALDGFCDISNEIFVVSIMVKDFMFFGFSYFVNDWTAHAGPAEVFYVFGGASFAVSMTGIVVFVFGKRYRAYWAQHNLLEKFHIKISTT